MVFLLRLTQEVFMATTVLASKGQVIIPSPIRTANQWEPGQRFEAIDTGDGVLLKPATPFPRTDITEVASCLIKYSLPFIGKLLIVFQGVSDKLQHLLGLGNPFSSSRFRFRVYPLTR